MKFLILPLLTLLLISCTDKVNHNLSTKDTQRSVQADQNIKNSFGVSANNTSFEVQSFFSGQIIDVENRADITIQKSALDKEFILHAQMIQQPSVPMFGNLKSRIVAFKLVDNFLYMLEANKGHQVTKDLPQSLILTRFPILSVNETEVRFDFNQGMNNVLIAGDWRTHREGYDYDGELISIDNKLTFIDQAYVDSKNNLVIRQLGRLSIQTDKGATNFPVEMKYYLSPYSPSENFVPTIAPVNMDKKGYFEVAAQYDAKGFVKNYASKHNKNKTIVYAVSANTPSEYVQAVKDGALYWNRYFDKEVIQVVVAPEGRTAPDSEYNIIQWVPWEAAGFAYADAQMDPRTGEIRHAQVFMTSVFAISGKVNAIRLIEAVSKGQVSVRRGLPLTLEGFESQSFCHYSALDSFVSELQSLVAQGADDSVFLEASKDYVREVLAHEVGHTMGLRHNFAASLETNIPTTERFSFYKDYMQGELDLNTVTPANSVMEYQAYIESVITGDLMEKTDRKFSYDEYAIRSLYYGEELSTHPLFCTDDHTSGPTSFLDCNRFDVGKNLAEAVSSDHDSLKTLRVRLIDSFVKLKVNISGDNVHSIESYPLATSLELASRAKSLTEARTRWVQSTSKDARLLSVYRGFPYVDNSNIEQVEAAQADWATKQVLNYGHLNLSPIIANDWAQIEFESFAKQLENETTVEMLFKAYGRNDLSFTSDERIVILTKVEAFYKLLQERMVLEDIKAFKQVDFALNNLSLSFQSLLGEKLKTYLFAIDNFKKHIYVDKNKSSKTISVPSYKYSIEVRQEALNLLESDIPNWMKLERVEIKTQMEDMVVQAFGEEKIEEIHADYMSPYLATWYQDFMLIYENL